MHFPVLVLIPSNTTDVWETVERMLLSYAIEYGDTAPRKEYVSIKAIENMAARYHAHPTDREVIAYVVRGERRQLAAVSAYGWYTLGWMRMRLSLSCLVALEEGGRGRE